MININDRKFKIFLYIILYSLIASILASIGLIASQIYYRHNYDKIKYVPKDITVYLNDNDKMRIFNINTSMCSDIIINGEDNISDFEIWKDKIVYLSIKNRNITICDREGFCEIIEIPKDYLSGRCRVIGNKNGLFFITYFDVVKCLYYMPFKSKTWVKIDNVDKVISQSETTMSFLYDYQGRGVYWDTDYDIKNVNFAEKSNPIRAIDFKSKITLYSNLTVKKNEEEIGVIKMPFWHTIMRAYIFSEIDEVWIVTEKGLGGQFGIYIYGIDGTYKGVLDCFDLIKGHKSNIRVGGNNIQIIQNSNPLRVMIK